MKKTLIALVLFFGIAFCENDLTSILKDLNLVDQYETAVDKTIENAIGFVFCGTVAAWGWTCTNNNGQFYIKFTSAWFTIKSASCLVKTVYHLGKAFYLSNTMENLK